MFFNTPFKNNHKESISFFFETLVKEEIPILKNFYNSNSVFFLDTFTTSSGYRFEEKVRNENNLSRCFRIDSRAHDLMQLTDILLGITVFQITNKKTKSEAKLRLVKAFDKELQSLQKSKLHHKSVYYF